MKIAQWTAVVILVAGVGWVRGQGPDVTLPPPRVGNGEATAAEKTPPPAPPANGLLQFGKDAAPVGPPPGELALPGAFAAPLPLTPRYLSFDADYAIFYFPTGREAMPLVRTDNLGNATSRTIARLGDMEVSRRSVQGAQFTLGYWGAEKNPWVPGGLLPVWGAEARVFFTGQESVEAVLEKSPILLRPFFDLNNNAESGVLVAAPGLGSGSIAARANANYWGGEANLWRNVYYDAPGTSISFDVMTGFRYLNLNAAIEIERFTRYDSNIVGFPQFLRFAGNRIEEQESFRTQNHFYGGQLGGAAHLHLGGGMTLTGRTQIGIGVTHQEIAVDGSHLRTTPGGRQFLSQGALLALPSNIGRYSRNRFTLNPELGINLSVPVLRWLTLQGGFSAMYWNRIVLPGEQIDRSVDITQIPNFPGRRQVAATGLNRPMVPFQQTELWILAATFGAEFRW